MSFTRGNEFQPGFIPWSLSCLVDAWNSDPSRKLYICCLVGKQKGAPKKAEGKMQKRAASSGEGDPSDSSGVFASPQR